MTGCPVAHECELVERRKGERRQVYQQSAKWCARFVGIVVVATSAISIGSAVSITTYSANKRMQQPAAERAALRRDVEALVRRVEALEQLESHRHAVQVMP